MRSVFTGGKKVRALQMCSKKSLDVNSSFKLASSDGDGCSATGKQRTELVKNWIRDEAFDLRQWSSFDISKKGHCCDFASFQTRPSSAW